MKVQTKRGTPPWYSSLETLPVALGLAAIGVVLVVVGLGMDRIPLDALSGLITLLALFAASMPLLSWLARQEGDPDLGRILFWGLVAAVVGMGIRYFFVTVVYADNADAGVYSKAAILQLREFKNGVFSIVPPGLENRPPESQRIALVVTIVYMFTGASRWAATFVFAWMGFAGRLLMWRALKRALPEADHKRYLIIIMFFPSLLFWPASIGKEALMILAISVVSYGAAQLFSDKVTAGGIVMFVAGVLGLVFVRPHMAAIAVAALGLGSLVGSLGRIGKGAPLKSTLVRAAALAVLVVVAIAVFSQTSKFFGGSEGDTGGVGGVLDSTKDQTSIGGSKFAAPAVNSPLDLPWATITVLFRPFPWEARNPNSFISSMEGLFLFVIVVAGWRRFVAGAKLALRRPYLVFVATFTVVFIMAFSYVGNFGILARQRTQLLPLLLVFLAIPPVTRGRGLFRSGEEQSTPNVPAEPAVTTEESEHRSDDRPQSPILSPVGFAVGSSQRNPRADRPFEQRP